MFYLYFKDIYKNIIGNTPNGTKLRVQTGHVLSQQTKDYIDNMIYENRNLSFILMPEGRIVPDSAGNTYAYEYFIKDHLGNTRAIIDHSSQILEHTAYYPFGMPIAALSYTIIEPQNKYLYNGKEFVDDFDLDWLEYGARMYDAQVGRWWASDPLAEKYYSFTPYNYVANSPMVLVDPNGTDIVVTVGEDDNERKEYLYEKYKKTVSNAFGGKVSVNIDENGKVTFEQTGKLKGYDKKAFKMLNNIATNTDATANLILMDSDSEGSENISVGNFETGQIDLDDMAAYGNDKEWMTTKGKIVHETTEQFEKNKLAQQGENVSIRDNSGEISQAYWKSHGKGTDAENECNKFQRGQYYNTGTKDGRAYNWYEDKNKNGQVIRLRYEDVGPVINNN